MAAAPAAAAAAPPVGNGGAQGHKVREWGLWSFKGKRRTMEETHAVCDPLVGDLALFAVFDGHGGKGAAAYCQEHLASAVAAQAAAAGNKALGDEAWARVFTQVDEGIKASGVEYAGTTAAVCLWDAAARALAVANVGDTHAVLVPAGEDGTLQPASARRLTTEHHAEGAEAARITAAGGFVSDGRVNGMVAVTRSLGDHNMKALLVSEPAVARVDAVPAGSVVLVACDGVWDVLTTEAVAAALAAPPTPTETAAECAKRVLKAAYDKGSTDNLSVMVVRL